MKKLLMFLLAISALDAMGQTRLRTRALYPHMRFKVKGCPNKIVVHYTEKYIMQCNKIYSCIELKNEFNSSVFKILFRKESGKIYCFPINERSKIKKTDCYESLMVNFSDTLNSKRFGGETERDEFPVILIKKEVDKNYINTFTYLIGYLPPSSSPYMDSLKVNEKFEILGVNYIVPGYEHDNGKYYGLIEFKPRN